MKIIGLTGGIGSGKSTVSRFLEELGATTIDSDKLGHEALNTDAGLKREVAAAFGQEVVNPDGSIDRGQLGKVVFGNRQLLTRLNELTHPRIHAMIKARLEEYRRQGVAVAVVEAPLLIEAGWTPLVDEVWVTVAPQATVLERLKGKPGLSREEALARIRAQLSAGERTKHADRVIDTDLSLNELKVKVAELWRSLQG
ncbi:dephospho-CoA kinase [Chloroflexota bacterium]